MTEVQGSKERKRNLLNKEKSLKEMKRKSVQKKKLMDTSCESNVIKTVVEERFIKKCTFCWLMI